MSFSPSRYTMLSGKKSGTGQICSFTGICFLCLLGTRRREEARQVWADLRSEEVLFDQHTYGDIVRAFTDGGLLDLAMEFYDEMRSSPDPPLSLPFRVMLKGLIPYPELREKMKEDFLELFPNMIIYDPPENLSNDEQR
ncbi:putative LRR receptor-like serine/threonine-protein kinase [Iris pallida]|uniref:LRR receptor-like serine/threonine-protein kinase n=1 Tax=Iris pallida TaxID=29817 RepID=A0AAX6FRP2_IRIPA|nr:putative LRR receptor-like serine/threonine-protein kinase [Iris pallida]